MRGEQHACMHAAGREGNGGGAACAPAQRRQCVHCSSASQWRAHASRFMTWGMTRRGVPISST